MRKNNGTNSCKTYNLNGTTMGWLIDPHLKLIFTYTNGSHPQVFESDNEVISVPNFAENLQITLGEVFGWLQVQINIKSAP